MEYLNEYFPNEISNVIYNDFLEVRTFKELMYSYYGDKFKLKEYFKRIGYPENIVNLSSEIIYEISLHQQINLISSYVSNSKNNSLTYNYLYEIDNYILYFSFTIRTNTHSTNISFALNDCLDYESFILFLNKSVKVIKKSKFNPLHFLDRRSINNNDGNIPFLLAFFKFFYKNNYTRKFVKYIKNKCIDS